MADLRLAVEFVGNDQGLTQVITNVTNKVEGLGVKANAAGHLLGGLARSALNSLGGLAANAIAVGPAFEKGLSEVKALSGESAENMEALRKLSLDLAKGMDGLSVSAVEVNEGFRELIKGGVSVQDVLGGAAKAVVELSQAGGVGLAEAAALASTVMAQFNKNGSDMAHISNLIAGAANASAIDVSDFRLSTQQAGAVAKITGLSFEDLAASIALMGKRGIAGSDAGTSLKTMLLNLIPTTNTAKTVMRQLGILTADGSNQFINASGSVKTMAEISDVLAKATAHLTKAQRSQALELIFGTDAIRAAAIFADAGAEGFNDMAEAINKVKAADVARQRLDNLSGTLLRIRNILQALAIEIGTKFTPSFNDLFKAILRGITLSYDSVVEFADFLGRRLYNAINTLKGALAGDWIPSVGVDKFSLAIGNAGLVLGKVFNAVKTFKGAVQGDWFGQNNTQIDKSARLFGIYGQYVKGVVDNLALLSKAFSTGLRLPPEAGNTISALSGLSAAFGRLIRISAGVGGNIKSAVFDGLINSFRQIASIIPSLMNALRALSSGGAGYIEIITNVMSRLTLTVADFGTSIQGSLNKLSSGDITGFLGDLVAGFIKGRIATAKTLVEWSEAFVKWAAHLWSDIRPEVYNLLDRLKSWLQHSANNILESIKPWGKSFISWIEGVWPSMLAGLLGLWTNISTWISNSASFINANMAGWVSSFTSWASNLWASVSPDLGTFVNGLKGWIDSLNVSENLGKLVEQFKSWAAGLWPSVLEGLGVFGQEFLKWVTGIPGYIQENINTWWSPFVTWAGGIWTSVVEHLPEFLTKIKKWLEDAADYITKNIGPWSKALKDWAKSVADTVNKWLKPLTDAINEFLSDEKRSKDLIKSTAAWVGAVMKWAIDATNTVVDELGKFGKSIIKWFDDNGENVGKAVGYFLANLLVDVVPKLYELQGKIIKLVVDLGVGVFKAAVKVGWGFIQGFVGGLWENREILISNLVALLKTAIQNALKIVDPKGDISRFLGLDKILAGDVSKLPTVPEAKLTGTPKDIPVPPELGEPTAGSRGGATVGAMSIPPEKTAVPANQNIELRVENIFYVNNAEDLERIKREIAEMPAKIERYLADALETADTRRSQRGVTLS